MARRTTLDLYSFSLALQAEKISWKKSARIWHRKTIGVKKHSLPAIDDKIHYQAKIHQGAYVQVFKAIYKGKDAGVKLLNLEKIKDPELAQKGIEEFIREASILSELDHPYIVKLLGADLDSPTLKIIILEWLDGGDLYHYLHVQNRQLKATYDILRIAENLADAYEFMHSKNIVNRDIKSLNVMIDHKGKITVIDFGTARLEAQDGDMTPRTGSYRWAAPEVLRDEHYFRSVDVYSFGIVLWEMITAKLPYDGMTAEEAGNSVAHDDIRPGDLVESDTCSAEMISLVTRCWSSKPKDRPTFSEIHRQLLAMIDAIPPEKRVSSVQHTSRACVIS